MMASEQKKSSNLMIEQIQQSLLQNEEFIMQLKTKILSIPSSSESQKTVELDEIRESQFMKEPNIKVIKKDDLDFVIQEISAILTDLIDQKLQYEMNEMIQENNNILLQIKQNLIFQQKESYSILGGSKNFYQQEQKNEISFSDVHRLIAEQKRKFEGQKENVSDAEIQKSLSCLVEFKFESIEQKVLNVDKRLKTMQDKYETNLKSIWNVLSMTEGAVFDFINKQKQKQKQQSESQEKQKLNEKIKKSQTTEKKSGFFKLW